MGKVTQKFMDLPVNSTIGIRGPFGNGFPIKEMDGARTHSDLLFRDTFPLPDREEGGRKGLEVLWTVDEADEEWRGNIGLVTELFSKTELFLSFERRMQCGMGIYGHCMIGQKRVCLDGPRPP